MINLSIKQVDRAGLGIVVIITLICGYLAVGHVAKKMKQFGIEKNVLSKRMNEVNLAAANLGDLKAVLAETKKELGLLDERIPESGKSGILLKQINSLIKQRRVTLIRVQLLPFEQEKNYLKIPVQLLLNGKFVDIYHLIRDLEKINRVVLMKKMTISLQKNSEQCRVELMTNVFERSKTI